MSLKVACIQIKAQDWNNADIAWESAKEKIMVSCKDNDLLVLPECVFPAYFLSPTENHAEKISLSDIKKELSKICRENKVYITFGYAEDNKNKATLIDSDGNEIAQKSKSNLWHFDKNWFVSGEDISVVDTEFGKIGMIICADARMPELVRSVSLRGVKLIIDLANLTASGNDISQLTNAQCEYMLSTRARENGVWLAMSDKWSVEVDCVTYAGRSAIYSPDGRKVAQAPSDKDDIVSYAIPTDSEGIVICESGIERMPVRRPELYEILCRDTVDTPVYKILKKAVIPESMSAYVIVNSHLNGSFDKQKRLKHLDRLIQNKADIIVMPTVDEIIDDLDDYQQLLSKEQYLVVGDRICEQTRSRIISNDTILSEYKTAHTFVGEIEKGNNDISRVVNTSFGNIGFIHEYEMLLPEVVRCNMLEGVDIVIWQHGMSYKEALPLARTRAAENMVYIVAVYSICLDDKSSKDASSFIIDPSGNIKAATLSGLNLHATGCYCNLSDSRIKSIVPGTHIVLDRKPQRYDELI